MKCYSCSQAEAQSRLLVNYMGHAAEVHLCADCLEGLKQYASSILKEVRDRGYVSAQPYAWPNFELRVPPTEVVQPDDNSFLADAGEKFRHRRRLGELRQRLQTAVQGEDYESAAALRDEISRMENEVFVCDDA